MLTLACRGCCCGTSKHPDVDHAAHLRALADTGTTLEVTPCLGPCRWSNIVVAIDEQTGDQTWFAKVLSDADLTAVTTWLVDPTIDPPQHLVHAPALPHAMRASLIARHHGAAQPVRITQR